MSGYKFSFNVNKDHMAKSLGVAMPISTKQSVEVCKSVRGMKLEKAKSYLEAVIAMNRAVSFRRYNKNVGHKPKVGPGRYPIKASSYILKVLKSAESNALHKGLNVNSLFLVHCSAQAAARAWHYGRHTRRRTKRTNIEIVLEEREIKEHPREVKKEEKQIEKKPESKVTEKPKEKKEEEKPEPKEAPKVEKPQVKETPKAAEEKPEEKAVPKPVKKKSKSKVKETKAKPKTENRKPKTEKKVTKK